MPAPRLPLVIPPRFRQSMADAIGDSTPSHSDPFLRWRAPLIRSAPMHLKQLLRAPSRAFVLLLLCASTEALLSAQAPKTAITATFTATTAALSAGAGVALKIDILRWSTDEEAAKLVATFKDKGDKAWSETLQPAPSVGYVWAGTSSLGYSVKSARRVATPDGGARIILAIDRPLGSWDRPAWKAAVGATDYAFTVIELRVNKAGIGEGKTSLTGKVAIDDGAKAVAIESYATDPVTVKS